MRHWKAYSRTRTFHGSVGGMLCECVPLNAFDDPEQARDEGALCSRGKLQIALLGIRTRLMQGFIVLLLLLYSPLASKIFGIFNCIHVGGERLLVQDFKLSCEDPIWGLYAFWAFGAILMYIIGIPVLTFSMVWRERTQNVEQYIDDLFPTCADDDDADEVALAREKALAAVNGQRLVTVGDSELPSARPSSMRPMMNSLKLQVNQAINPSHSRIAPASRKSDPRASARVELHSVTHTDEDATGVAAHHESRLVAAESSAEAPPAGCWNRFKWRLGALLHSYLYFLDFVLEEDSNVDRRRELSKERGYYLTATDLDRERKEVLEAAFLDAIHHQIIPVDPKSSDTEKLRNAARLYLYRLNLMSYWTTAKIGSTFARCT